MTTSEFTREQILAINADLQAALKSVGDKHGIDFSTGRISFTPLDFKTSLTAALRAPNADEQLLPASHKWVVAWNRYAPQFGLQVADLGRTFTLPEFGRLKIAGLTQFGKQPIVAKPLDRKTSKFMLVSADAVIKALQTAN